MKLTDDPIDPLLREQLFAPKGSNRRRHPRSAPVKPIPATLEFGSSASIKPMSATVRDMSRSGIGLNVPARVPSGTAFTLILDCGSAGRRSIRCSVMNCRLIGKSGYILGARFEEINVDAQFTAPEETPADPAERNRIAELEARLRDALR